MWSSKTGTSKLQGCRELQGRRRTRGGVGRGWGAANYRGGGFLWLSNWYVFRNRVPALRAAVVVSPHAMSFSRAAELAEDHDEDILQVYGEHDLGCPSVSEKHCSSDIFNIMQEAVSGELSSSAGVILCICCMQQHLENANVQRTTIAVLTSHYETRAPVAPLTKQAALLVTAGQASLAAMDQHPSDTQLHDLSVALLSILGRVGGFDASALVRNAIESSDEDGGPAEEGSHGWTQHPVALVAITVCVILARLLLPTLLCHVTTSGGARQGASRGGSGGKAAASSRRAQRSNQRSSRDRTAVSLTPAPEPRGAASPGAAGAGGASEKLLEPKNATLSSTSCRTRGKRRNRQATSLSRAEKLEPQEPEGESEPRTLQPEEPHAEEPEEKPEEQPEPLEQLEDQPELRIEQKLHQRELTVGPIVAAARVESSGHGHINDGRRDPAADMPPPEGSSQCSQILEVELEAPADASNLDDSRLCVICLDAERTHAAIPCGHRVLCATCGKIAHKRCPLCRASVDFIVRVWD